METIVRLPNGNYSETAALFVAYKKCKKIFMRIIMDKKNQTKQMPACPVETTLVLIGSKWKVLILRDLVSGKKRFGELKRSIGNVSQKVLTAQLREMEADALLERTVYAEVPPRVEYELTPLGMTLKPILDTMETWGREYKAMKGEGKA